MQRVLVPVLLIFIILTGCTSNETKDSSSKDVDIRKLSTNESIKQDTSNQAKEILKKYDEIKSVVAINTKKKLVVGVSVHQASRFQLKSLRKEWTKRLEKAFPDKDVDLTTDKKIIWELTELEKKLNGKDIPKKKLKKEIKRIIKLMKETA